MLTRKLARNFELGDQRQVGGQQAHPPITLDKPAASTRQHGVRRAWNEATDLDSIDQSRLHNQTVAERRHRPPEVPLGHPRERHGPGVLGQEAGSEPQDSFPQRRCILQRIWAVVGEPVSDIRSERKPLPIALALAALGGITLALYGLRTGLAAWGVVAVVLISLAFILSCWRLARHGIFPVQPIRSVNRKSRRISQTILVAYIGAISTVVLFSYPWG